MLFCLKIIQPDGEDVIASPDDGELTGQQQLNDQANNSKTNKFTSGIKNVFSFGNKSDPVIGDANLGNNNEVKFIEQLICFLFKNYIRNIVI